MSGCKPDLRVPNTLSKGQCHVDDVTYGSENDNVTTTIV